MARARTFGFPSRPDERRLVLALCLTTFLLWIGSSAILPLLPYYLRQHGSTPALVGVVMAAYFGASVLTQYPAGRISDRIGRRRVVWSGLVVFALGSVGFALSAGAGPAIFFRALQGIGAGAVTVASAAMIGSTVARRERGGSFGALYGGQMLAMAIGPLLGSLVGATSMRLLFLVGAGSALVAFVPLASTMRRVPEHRLTPYVGTDLGTGELTALSGAAAGGVPGGLRRHEFSFNPAVVGVLLEFVATGLLVGVYEACWTLLLRLRGASQFEVGFSWTLFALPFALLSVPAGMLAGRFDRRYLAIGGLVSSAVFCAIYPFIHSVPWLVGLGSLEAACSVIGAPAAVVILAQAAPSRSQGQAQGTLETGRTAATAAAAAGAGAMFAVGAAIPFLAAAVLTLASCAVMAWIWRDLDADTRGGAVAGLAAPGPGGEDGNVALADVGRTPRTRAGSVG